MLGLLGSIPFIGKYKRYLGAILYVGGIVTSAVGADNVGQQLQEYGMGVLAVGVAHAEVKEKRRK